MTENAGGDPRASDHREEPGGDQPGRRGRPSSWTLVTVDILALFVGGLAVIGDWWVAFWGCAAVVVLSVPAGKVIGVMDNAVQAGEAPRT